MPAEVTSKAKAPLYPLLYLDRRWNGDCCDLVLAPDMLQTRQPLLVFCCEPKFQKKKNFSCRKSKYRSTLLTTPSQLIWEVTGIRDSLSPLPVFEEQSISVSRKTVWVVMRLRLFQGVFVFDEMYCFETDTQFMAF